MALSIETKGVNSEVGIIQRVRGTVTSTSVPGSPTIPAASPPNLDPNQTDNAANYSIQVVGISLNAVGASGAVNFWFQDNSGTPVILSRKYKLDSSGTNGDKSVYRPICDMGVGVDAAGLGKGVNVMIDAALGVSYEIDYVLLRNPTK